jgi:pyruvate dehydrogenase E1 component alpha subunit
MGVKAGGMDDTEKRELMRGLLLTRVFEEKCVEVHQSGGIPETPHSSIGQEAVGVGGCLALEEEDIVSPSLRTRAAMLLRVPLEEIVAGMFGTVSGPSKGRTTQHHMGDTGAGILGTTGLIGSHLNPSVGAGLGSDRLGTDAVTLVFFGDGASTRGELHSALNFATAFEVPVVFLLENNEYTEMTPIDRLTAVDDLSSFAGHGLPTEVVDGQDVEAVYGATRTAVERARAGEGPTFVEAKTRRFRPHAETVPDSRDREEVERLRERDPVEIYEEQLRSEGVFTESELADLRAELEAEVEAAFAAVADDPEPDEEVMYHVYSDVDVAPDGVVER